MHMMVARELAVELASEAVRAEPGAYYLGATSPDIRVITKWDRSRTHFFDLNEFGHQSGTEVLISEHPDLVAACAAPRTIAFVCGYISHLEMDEAWICDVYRPCFGERSPLKGDVFANLLDRVLQFELDRRQREDAIAVDEIHNDLLACAIQATVGFIDDETLLRWRDVSVELLERPADWDRFGVIASRHLRAYGVESEEDLAHFLQNIPDLLDQSIREVTPERLDTFLETSRRRALTAMRAYLS
jgi:hypothetical protein